MKVVAEYHYSKNKQIGAGQGLNSLVFHCTDPQLGGEIAVKEIEKAKLPNVGAYFQEAQTMFQARHDNVVPVHLACQTTSHVSIVMPFYAQGSLTTRIEHGPLSPLAAIRMSRGVLTGLSHIHAQGFVHFDVKPANVLFSDAGVPLVSDFGQSRKMLPMGCRGALRATR